MQAEFSWLHLMRRSGQPSGAERAHEERRIASAVVESEQKQLGRSRLINSENERESSRANATEQNERVRARRGTGVGQAETRACDPVEPPCGQRQKARLERTPRRFCHGKR